MSHVALGVSSSISIYKACEVLRGFQKKGFQVRVIMTKNATSLISPLLFSSLSGQDAIVDLFDERVSRKLEHISLAREISLLCVAPATANIIGKFAQGVADDFLSTFFMAVRCPVLVAPAMNESMYLHPQTQVNMQALRSRGVEFVEPEKGYLACQDEGWGRLASPERIVGEGLKILARTKSLEGKVILITAGPTREPLDPVRFLSNRSSGKMGYELAREALGRGAEVILVSGPVSIPPPADARLVRVETAGEMESAVLENYPRADIVIMAAAVADFRFAGPSARKVKKARLPGSLEIVRTADILAKLGSNKGRKILVGFAAETEELLARARKKLTDKKVDMIVANNVAQSGIGFESDSNKVTLVQRNGEIFEVPLMSKREVSRVILDRIEVLRAKKN